MNDMSLDRRLCVAPMMDWTDRHCRYFHRLLSPHAVLYTEMVHANAVIHGDAHRHLRFDKAEHPIALQWGGIDAADLAKATQIAQHYAYDEINLNCGCPSDRVQKGQFGACLMEEPERVAEAVAAMQEVTNIPVTVKTRLGIDDKDDYEFLARFVDIVHSQGGCNVFVLHARKAWLKGLSPKENRSIPPLDWDRVHQIKRDFPQMEIIINGGFEFVDDIMAQYHHVDGVMIGRRAYHVPYDLAVWEEAVYGTALPNRADIVKAMCAYMERELEDGNHLKRITRHMMGLYHGQPLSKAWKHALHDAAQSNSLEPLKPFAEQ
jgi:tRNA-dihydrouridine synthase A